MPMLYHFWILLVSIFCYNCLAFAAKERPKVYDCFLFFNELDILDVKLNELYDHVDYFVIVESVETFRGNLKPLYFEINKDRYRKFLDKIIHVILEERQLTDNPWDRERYQRNQISRGLLGCKLNDIVIVEDADEIVRASKIPEIIRLLTKNQTQYVKCRQNIYTYYLNRTDPRSGEVTSWDGSIATSYTNVKYETPNGVRWGDANSYKEYKANTNTLDNAGWHFTYMGGIPKVQLKLESFSHSELDNDHDKDPRKILEEIQSLKIVPIDGTYPLHIQKNIDYYTKIGFIEAF